MPLLREVEPLLRDTELPEVLRETDEEVLLPTEEPVEIPIDIIEIETPG